MAQKDSNVNWSEVYALAGQIDTLWLTKMHETWRPGCPECCKSQYGIFGNYNDSSYRKGIPGLRSDNTAPFASEFSKGEFASEGGDALQLHQRFEFGYSDAITTAEISDNCIQAPASPAEVDMHYTYPYYHDGVIYPILHSQFLVIDPEKSSDENNYYSTHNCQQDTWLTSEGHCGNLIESHLDQIHEWWFSKDDQRRRLNPTISGELYFVVTPKQETGEEGDDSWEGRCPCGGVFRVAFAGNIANGNGNSYYQGDRQHCVNCEQVHEWGIYGVSNGKVDSENAITADCLTLTQRDWDQLLPETAVMSGGNIQSKLYQPPPSGCCPTIIFPKLGYQGGGCKFNMYSRSVLRPGFSGKPTADETSGLESYAVLWDGTLKEYNTISGEAVGNNGTIRYIKQTINGVEKQLYYHILPKDIIQYDETSVAEYQNWTRVCGNGGWGGHRVDTGPGIVRVTAMRFIYSPDNKYYADTTGHEGELRVAIVGVPTSLTISLQGTYKPAIRKRWYDMMYYKLRWIMGCMPPPPDSFQNMPMGTSWDASTDYELTKKDRMASFWLSQDVAWENYKEGETSEYEYNKATLMPPLKPDGEYITKECIPFGTEISNFELQTSPNICTWDESEAQNNGLCDYVVEESGYEHLAAPYEFFYGEKYTEQLLCVKNMTENYEVSCPGEGSWNEASGCFCSKLIEESGGGQASEESSNACEYPQYSQEDSEASDFWNDQSGRIGMRNPNPDDCQTSGEQSSSVEFSRSDDLNAWDCVNYACRLDLQLPWDGGCANDNCECLTCGSGPKTYAYTFNMLQKLVEFTTAHKVSEPDIEFQPLDRWRLFYRNGMPGNTESVVHVAPNDSLETTFPGNCQCSGNGMTEVSYVETFLYDHLHCTEYNLMCRNPRTDSFNQTSNWYEGYPAYMKNNSATQTSGAELYVDSRAGRSPIQICIYRPFLVYNKEVKLTIKISKDDLNKILATYWVNKSHPIGLSPVCGYIAGEVLYGPFCHEHGAMRSHHSNSFTLSPRETPRSSLPPYNSDDGSVLCYDYENGEDPYLTDKNEEFYINDDGMWEFNTTLNFADRSFYEDYEEAFGHYRKYIVINLTVDHDGYGMHGGGPASDYEYSATEVNVYDCNASTQQTCLVSLLTGTSNLANSGGVPAPYKSGPGKFLITLETIEN